MTKITKNLNVTFMMKKSTLLLLTLLFGAFSYAYAAEPEIVFNCQKTDWATIGSENGEAVGTVTLKNGTLDHFEAEIRCKEDIDQYITFANTSTNGGTLYCYCWEGGTYQLNSGYHYTITIKAFNVPYYGVAPIATTTYEFVGTGSTPIPYNDDIKLVKVDLNANNIIMNGYDINGMSFDVTFSAPVSQVVPWWAKGFDGTQMLTATKKNSSGTVWTVNLSSDVMSAEGAANIMIAAWDMNGVQLRGDNGDHAFGINIVVSGIAANMLTPAGNAKKQYNLAGQQVSAGKGIVISDGKKYIAK